MIGNTPYISFDAALNAAKANDTIVVLDDKVELTGTITIDKALTIKGNGSNVIEITAPSTSRGKALSLTASLTLDNMDLTIKGSGAEGAGLGDAIEVGESGTTTSVEFKAINGSKVTFRNLQNGFVLPAGENGKVTFTSSALDVSGVRGNLSNGGVWTLNSADVDVNGGDYALSVYTLATTEPPI